ncbi:SPFH domain-containing protein [Streptomyces sp. NPDC002814]
MGVLITVLVVFATAGLVLLAMSLRVIRPIGDRMRKVSVQTEVLGIPPQGSITADNVTLTVDAVVYFRVIGRADLDKDIALPGSMMRSMSKQAEAERERRARVIAADGEFQASQRLSDAAATMADTPGALQLRLLQTVVNVSAEKNSTLVMPFPVEMLRFFEHQSRNTDGESAHRSTPRPALPELTTPGPPATPTFSLRGEPVGSLSGERPGSRAQRIGNRAAVAREQRDNRPTPADSDSGASHAHS